MTDAAWINAAITAARPQAVGALLRYFRDLDTAEEAFQDACRPLRFDRIRHKLYDDGQMERAQTLTGSATDGGSQIELAAEAVHDRISPLAADVA